MDIPNPIDASQVALPQALLELTERLAEQAVRAGLELIAAVTSLKTSNRLPRSLRVLSAITYAVRLCNALQARCKVRPS